MSFKKMKSAFYLVSALSLTCFTGSALAQSSATVLKVATMEVADAPNTMGWEVFKQYVESESNGRYKIDIHHSSQLGSSTELIQAVSSGALKIVHGDETIAAIYDPMLVLSIPYLFSNEVVVRKFFESPFFEKISEGFTKKSGIRVLASQTYGFRSFINSQRPITNIKDIEGLKIRVQDNPLMVKFIQSLGALPTTTSWGELYSALQQKVVDGAENPPGLVYDAKFYEVTKYMSLDQHTLAFNFFYVNDDWYNKLSDEDKDIFYTASLLGSAVEFGERIYGNRVSTLGLLEKKGMEINTLGADELARFKEASQPVILEWLKGRIGEEMVNEALDQVKQIETQIMKEATAKN
ncbi:TRAP transporter substrate-binding protein [Castellaniella sp.]|uniref:TRAP transporter substrate-binding protein n=1 Tax=Castellaniella sp. TaxID=1955812 RepID=UPI00355EBE2D